MTSDRDKIERYWTAYLAGLPEDSAVRQQQYVAEGFGDGPELANELGRLVLSGVKTATCSAVWEWQAEGRSIPEVGLKTIVLDGAGKPLCIIETTEVNIRPYEEVDASFAREEGEGDLSLDFWKGAHWRYFSRTLPRIGKQPTPDMPLVCERFRVVFPEALASTLEYAIREARAEDLELLPSVELAAAALFVDRAEELGVPLSVLEQVKSVEDLRNAQKSGWVLVAVDARDQPIGFAVAVELDGALHLDELDVVPEHGRKGVGSALLEALCRLGKSKGYAAVTLSTFRDVPWNGPFYARRGFEVIERSRCSAGLVALVASERERGLPIERRVIMRRDLAEGSSEGGGAV